MESKTSDPTKKQHWLLFVIVATWVCFAAFKDIQSLPIMDWDEARQGVNAYEMILNNDFIVHTYDGEVDTFNLKPPLSMWQLVVGFWIFGFNKVGLRFFSALFLVIITCHSMWFLKKNVNTYAALSVGVFLALFGPRFMHLFGTGDPDALHLLLSYFACICLYNAVTKDPKWMIGTGFLLGLDFLTKATHMACLLAVVCLSLLVLNKQHHIRAKALLLYGLLPLLTPITAWALTRYAADGSVFFSRMIEVDILRRVSSVMEGNSGGVLYYVQSTVWFVGLLESMLLLAVIVSAIWIARKRQLAVDKPLLVIFTLLAVVPFALYTPVPTKLPWYVYPSILGLAIVFAYACQILVTRYQAQTSRQKLILLALPLVVAAVVIDPHISNALTQRNQHNPSIFSMLNQTECSEYYCINVCGEEQPVQQSWLLEGYFCGYRHKPGDYQTFLDSNRSALLLVEFDPTQPEDLESLCGTEYETLVIYQSFAVLRYAGE